MMLHLNRPFASELLLLAPATQQRLNCEREREYRARGTVRSVDLDRVKAQHMNSPRDGARRIQRILLRDMNMHDMYDSHHN